MTTPEERAATAEAALAEALARVERLEKALDRIEHLAGLVAHDLSGRVEAGKVAAVQQCSDVARAALRRPGT